MTSLVHQARYAKQLLVFTFIHVLHQNSNVFFDEDGVKFGFLISKDDFFFPLLNVTKQIQAMSCVNPNFFPWYHDLDSRVNKASVILFYISKSYLNQVIIVFCY